MSKWLIIGYGNPLRGDDGFGWHAAQKLATTLEDEEVQVLACHQLTPELAEPISQATRVIFLDARVGGMAGITSWQPVKPASSLGSGLTHNVAPASLLTLASGLYGGSPFAMLVSVTGEEFGFSERLSPAVQEALEIVVERLCEMTGVGDEELWRTESVVEFPQLS